MRNTNLPLEILGWYGVAAILIGYALISFGVFPARSCPYQLLMLTGSLGIVINAYFKKDRQPLVLNLVFAFIALLSLISILIIK